MLSLIESRQKKNNKLISSKTAINFFLDDIIIVNIFLNIKVKLIDRKDYILSSVEFGSFGRR